VRGARPISWRAWGPVLIWLAVIWTVNSLPRQAFSEGIRKSPSADVQAHVLLYIPLGFFLMPALLMPGGGWRRVAGTLGLVVLLGAALGGLDEWHKVLIPTRKGEVGDWLRGGVEHEEAVAGNRRG